MGWKMYGGDELGSECAESGVFMKCLAKEGDTNVGCMGLKLRKRYSLLEAKR